MKFFRYLIVITTLFLAGSGFALEQACYAVMMVRPAQFGFNEDTAPSNTFQNPSTFLTIEGVHQQALQDFDQFVTTLRDNGIEVMVFQDTLDPYTPDSVFPNNWISFHHNGTVITYPMLAANRKRERELDVLTAINEKYHVSNLIHLHHYERYGRSLEGTGSIVFDHVNRIAYCNLSSRADQELLEQVADLLDYAPIAFHAYDHEGNEIYHTNVMMFVGSDVAVVCLESIEDLDERVFIADLLTRTKRDVVTITRKQMRHFCGNMLEVVNQDGERFIVMSEQAFQALEPEQENTLQNHAKLIHVPIGTIETTGGGGARCMLAGIHLQPRQSD